MTIVYIKVELYCKNSITSLSYNDLVKVRSLFDTAKWRYMRRHELDPFDLTALPQIYTTKYFSLKYCIEIWFIERFYARTHKSVLFS